MKRQGTGNKGTGIREQGSGSGGINWVPQVRIFGLGNIAGGAVVLLAALLATAPLWLRGASCGHDFDFHLVSWLDVQSAWRHGQFYPHWSPSSNFGAGEPRFVFYPPLTWMLGALLGFFLPWTVVPAALSFLLLAATGLATRALAREALDEALATLAGCLALFSGYTLFTAYERTAFGELAGGFWIPLVLLFALRNRFPNARLWQRVLDGSALPLALALAGAWLSNAPVGVMASYLLALVALVAAVQARSWTPVLRAILATVLGLGLASIYLLPAAYEQRWVDIRQATDDPGERIENSFLFAHHADPALALHDQELHRVSLLGASMLAVALVGIFFAWKQGRIKSRWWLPLALLPLAILFLQLPVSLPLWNLLPKLRFLQFPWRWLVALEAPMALFAAAALWPTRKKARIAVAAFCALFFVTATLYTARTFFQVCDDEDAVTSMVGVYRTGAGFIGTDEYAPPGSDATLMASGLPGACLVSDPDMVLGIAPPADGGDPPTPVWTAAQGSCDAVFTFLHQSQEKEEINASLAHAGFLILRLRAYPAWTVRVNGQEQKNLPRRDDGLMVVPVPQGPVHLTVDWTTTPDVRLSRWIAALATLLLILLWFAERKATRRRLS